MTGGPSGFNAELGGNRNAEGGQYARKEARRTLLNWVGCAVGGSRHETLDVALAALAPFSGPPQATVLGRRERLDILHAALASVTSAMRMPGIRRSSRCATASRRRLNRR